MPRLSCSRKGAGDIHLLAVCVQEGELLRIPILACYAWHHVPAAGPRLHSRVESATRLRATSQQQVGSDCRHIESSRSSCLGYSLLVFESLVVELGLNILSIPHSLGNCSVLGLDIPCIIGDPVHVLLQLVLSKIRYPSTAKVEYRAALVAFGKDVLRNGLLQGLI